MRPSAGVQGKGEISRQTLGAAPLGSQSCIPPWSFLGTTWLPCQRCGPVRGPQGEDITDKRKNPEVTAMERAIKMLLTSINDMGRGGPACRGKLHANTMRPLGKSPHSILYISRQWMQPLGETQRRTQHLRAWGGKREG